jgi:hypothetical protein
MPEGISFRDFVEHVAITPDNQLDTHWCSLRYLFGGYEPDYVGHFERLSEDFAPILEHARQLGYEVTPPPLSPKSHPKECASGSPGQYANVGHLALAGQDVTRIHPVDFYTPETIELVRNRFKNDIEQFGFDYEFQGNLNPNREAPSPLTRPGHSS